MTLFYMVQDVLSDGGTGANLNQWPLPPGTSYGLHPCDDGVWTLVVIDGWPSTAARYAWEDTTGAIAHPHWEWNNPVPAPKGVGALPVPANVPNWPGHFGSK